jgi:hypothetical protein
MRVFTVCQKRLSASGFLRVRRRQVVAQDLAARVERVGVEDQSAVAVIDAGTASRGLHQGPQDRGGALRVDGEIQRIRQIIVVAVLGVFRLKQLLGIELHFVGIDAGRRRDGAGDDLALRGEALHLGVDQARP